MGLAPSDARSFVGRGNGQLVLVFGWCVQDVSLAPSLAVVSVVDSGVCVALVFLLRIASGGGIVERQHRGMAFWSGGQGVSFVFAFGGRYSRASTSQGVLVVCGLEPCGVFDVEAVVRWVASGGVG